MKISAEVRKFARLNPSPLGDGDDSAQLSEGRGSPSEATSEAADQVAEASAKAEAGMAEMSKRFHDEGGEIYVPATE